MKLFNLVILSYFLLLLPNYSWSQSCETHLKLFVNIGQARPDYAVKGHFVEADKKLQTQVLDLFKSMKAKGNLVKKIDKSKVKRFFEKDLDINLRTMSKKKLKATKNLGLNNIGKLAYITSGAGLWSRGGGVVKALVPYNLAQLAGKQMDTINLLGDIVNAKTFKEALNLAKKDTSSLSELEIEDIGKEVVASSKKKLQAMIYEYSINPLAVTPIDMKLVNVALHSKQSNNYIPFDIWTSQQTHTKIAEYLSFFDQNYETKLFHPDSLIDQEIKSALKDYINESAQRSDTHLFGYQEGLKAIDTKTFKYSETSASIGKGAGAFLEYLRKSGRSNVLEKAGIKHLVFENIEIVSDLPTLYGSFLKIDKQSAVVLVPQKPGYAGGSPFLIKNANGSWNMELREMTSIDKDLAQGNRFFNSNTTFMDIDTPTPSTIGFELKNQGSEARAKENVGDITIGRSSGSIGGRIDHSGNMIEYENFKTISEFVLNGLRYINIFRKNWANSFNRGPNSIKKKNKSKK